MPSLEIAICGSGIGGMATAIALNATGHRVTIFEKVDIPRPVGAGLMLQPTGQAALARLGLAATCIAHGRKLAGIEGKTKSGRPIFDIAYDALGPGTFGLGIHRGTLFHILDTERRRRSIPVITAAGIASSRVEHGKRIVIDETDFNRGAFDLVVDATGFHSPLRDACAQVRLNRPYPYGAVWGVVHQPPDWPLTTWLTQRYDGARIMAGVLPIGHLPGATQPLAAFFWSLKTADLAVWRATKFSDWQDQVIALWPAAQPFVRQFTSHADLAPASYADIWLQEPFADRLAFIGDAARSASPQLGQGANLALIDAVVLADCLETEPSVDAALHAFATARRAHTRFYGLASRYLTPFFQSDSNLASRIRDAAFAPMARLPYIRREMVRTLAGLKTGLFTHQTPNGLVGTSALEPAATVHKPAGLT